MKIPKSASNMFRVSLARTFEHAGFTYVPSADAVTVNREILDAMIAKGVVDDVAAA